MCGRSGWIPTWPEDNCQASWLILVTLIFIHWVCPLIPLTTIPISRNNLRFASSRWRMPILELSFKINSYHLKFSNLYHIHFHGIPKPPFKSRMHNTCLLVTTYYPTVPIQKVPDWHGWVDIWKRFVVILPTAIGRVGHPRLCRAALSSEAGFDSWFAVPSCRFGTFTRQ